MIHMEHVVNIIMMLAACGAFLVGFKFLSDNMEKLASGGLKKMFSKTAGNKIIGVGIGAASTVIVQSSSVTTVMVVGFVNAGVMALSQAVGCIMGANIGTTLTVLMMSIDLPFEYIFCFVGCVLLFLPAKFKKLMREKFLKIAKENNL